MISSLKNNRTHFCVSVVTMLCALMMVTIIFLQLAVEIHAYSFIAKHNIQIGNIKKLQHKINNKKQKIADKETTTSLPAISFIKPIDGGVTSSKFGDTISRGAPHQGHDWAIESGSLVKASARGVVELAYYSDSYGYNILICHENNIKTRYAHLSKLYVSAGQEVSQNEVIGLSGNTGDSTGPHLHFEFVKSGKRVNPIKYLAK